MLDGCTIEDSIIGVRSVMSARDGPEVAADGGRSVPARRRPPGAPPLGIGEGTLIQNAIVDKNVRIGRNCRIVNKNGLTEGEGPGWVIREGIVVIPKNAIVPDDTTI